MSDPNIKWEYEDFYPKGKEANITKVSKDAKFIWFS